MQVAILVLGTRGDLELFVALGRALTRRGHRVAFGTSAFHAEPVRSAGLEWVPIGFGDREELVSVLRGVARVRDLTRRTQLYYLRWLRPQLAAAKRQLDTLAASADYFVSNMKMVLRRGDAVMPGASVTYDLPHALGDLSRYGADATDGEILDLVALSQPLVDPERRWGEHRHFTGFWRDESPASDRLSAKLEAFLAAGPPPVVVTLGSMVMFETDPLVAWLCETLRVAGTRGLFVGAWADLEERWEPDASFGVVREAPYAALFPRASCVVHHGGTGTVAAVLRAGRPSVLLPQIDCQLRFAELLEQRGVATGHFAAVHSAPSEVATAIRRATEDRDVAAATSRWQTLLSAEPGLAQACDLIEAHAADRVVTRSRLP